MKLTTQHPPCTRALCACFLALGVSTHARAEADGGSAGSSIGVPGAGGKASGSSPAHEGRGRPGQAQQGAASVAVGPLPAPSLAPTNPYARFNKYTTKGFNVPIPGPAAYIDPDPYGLRSALADAGIGYWGYTLNNFTYDVRNHGRTDGRQVYSGQKSSLTSYNYLYFTYDLSRFGIENGQISASLVNVYTTWVSAGPDMDRIGILQYYQTFGNGKVELIVGNVANSFTYVGIYVGGNLAAGTFGVNASIPSQVGLGSTFLARPGANVKFHFGRGFYDMAGVQRSVNPDGSMAEHKADPTGLSMGGRHVGNLFIDEFGYRRSAAPGKADTWVRLGYMKNTSDFLSKKDPGTRSDGNWAAYLLADRQLIPLGNNATQAGRGIYGGFSLMKAPSAINTFARYEELRFYVKGLFDARPNDMLSLVISRNEFSRYAVRSAKLAGSLTDHESAALSLSYSGMVIRGVTLFGGFSYINHPRPVVTSSDQKAGLNLEVGAHIYF